MSNRYSTVWDPYGSRTTGSTKTHRVNTFFALRTSKNHSEALYHSTTSYFGKREKLKPQLLLAGTVNSRGLSGWFPVFKSRLFCSRNTNSFLPTAGYRQSPETLETLSVQQTKSSCKQKTLQLTNPKTRSSVCLENLQKTCQHRTTNFGGISLCNCTGGPNSFQVVLT